MTSLTPTLSSGRPVCMCVCVVTRVIFSAGPVMELTSGMTLLPVPQRLKSGSHLAVVGRTERLGVEVGGGLSDRQELDTREAWFNSTLYRDWTGEPMWIIYSTITHLELLILELLFTAYNIKKTHSDSLAHNQVLRRAASSWGFKKYRGRI